MKSEQELDQLIAALPRDRQPEQDLWHSLAHRLPERQKTKKRQMSRVNQMLGLVATLSLMTIVAWRLLIVPDDSDLPALVSETDANVSEPLPARYAIAQQFESLKAEQLGELAPDRDTFGDWQYQLATWDRAIDQVGVALDYYPDDLQLLSQMQGLYEQQINYLRLIGRVDTNRYLSGEEL